MTLRSLKRRFAMFCVNRLFSGTRFFPAKASLLRFAGHRVGANARIVGPIFCTGTLWIGEDAWVGRGLTVHGNGTVTIGSRCDIGPDVTFLTGSHAIGPASRRAGAGRTCDIRVGDGTWIGARATILGDTAIGEGSVIAACACVTRDTPKNCLLGGVPAAVIRELPHEN